MDPSQTNAFDKRVRLELYRFFVENGRPPIASELAAVLDTRPIDVEESYRRLHDGHILVLAPGTPYVWMANPFSALPTPYVARVDDRTYFGNCVWDAMGIVAMLGGRGSIEAGCGDCGDLMSIEIGDGQLQTDRSIVHYAVPAAQWWDDIGFN